MSNKPTSQTRPNLKTHGADRGAALITALGMLVIFVIFGTAFLGYMTLENKNASNDLRGVRAQAAAEGGVYAAIGEIQAKLAAGQVAPRNIPQITFPVYDVDKKSGALTPSTQRAASAKITISDECARINLNQAPTAVLRAILGIDGDQARKLRSSLPHLGPGNITPAGHWLTTVDDLVSRGFMGAKSFNALDKNLLTVYSVPDNAHPGSYINLNSAPAKVLAAVLNLTPQAAAAAIAKRPFKSLADLRAAIGKGPQTFNVHAAGGAPDALPPELAFSSRCFRIHSEAQVTDAAILKPTRATIDTVVYFPDSGKPQIQYWSATD